MPEIIRRPDIGYDRARTGFNQGQVSRLVVHHFWKPDVPASATAAEERAVCRGVEDFHADMGWSASPGYNHMVADSGRIYEGVGFWRRGVHTAGLNSVAKAICFMNNGDADEPTEAAWDSASWLVSEYLRRGALSQAFILTGHRDHSSKTCPGNKTYPHLARLRTWDPKQEEDEMALTRSRQVSEDVKELQETCNHAVKHGPWDFEPDWYPLTVDGIYLDKTHEAVADLKELVFWNHGSWGGRAPFGFVSRLEAYIR